MGLLEGCSRFRCQALPLPLAGCIAYMLAGWTASAGSNSSSSSRGCSSGVALNLLYPQRRSRYFLNLTLDLALNINCMEYKNIACVMLQFADTLAKLSPAAAVGMYVYCRSLKARERHCFSLNLANNFGPKK